MKNITLGDIVEYQGSCWVVTGRSGSSYCLAQPGNPVNVHTVPRVAFTRVGPWR